MASPTVLFIGSSLSAGYSPAGAGRLTVLPNDAGGDLGLSIEALLAAMPGRQRQVHVLSTEVWSQAVTVESRSLRKIEKSQISQMLAFEAESFSGIPATIARTSLQLVEAGPVETTYWVSQIDSARFAQAADAVAFSGGRLLGLAHPSGLNAPLTSSRGNWSRLEVWDDMALVVSKAGRGPVKRQFLAEVDASVVTPAAARDAVQRSGIEPSGWMELLRASSATPESFDEEGELTELSASEDGSGLYDLRREDDLRAFLAAWSRSLKKPKQLPVLLPVRQRASAQTRRTLALAASAAAIIGIAAHHNHTTRTNSARLDELQVEIRDRQGPIEAFSQQQSELRDLKSQAEDSQQKHDRLQTQLAIFRGQLGIHRSRMGSLLKILGEDRPMDLVLSQIEGDRNRLRVVGRSMRAEAIIEFAKSMAQRLEPMNLSISVPRREALLMRADGGPYEFEYVISDGA